MQDLLGNSVKNQSNDACRSMPRRDLLKSMTMCVVLCACNLSLGVTRITTTRDGGKFEADMKQFLKEAGGGQHSWLHGRE
eukprot:4193992-Amphidinium_carterae.1